MIDLMNENQRLFAELIRRYDEMGARLAAAERVAELSCFATGVCFGCGNKEPGICPSDWHDSYRDWREAFAAYQKATEAYSVGLARELCHGCWKTGSDMHWANVPWHRACVEKPICERCGHSHVDYCHEGGNPPSYDVCGCPPDLNKGEQS